MNEKNPYGRSVRAVECLSTGEIISCPNSSYLKKIEKRYFKGEKLHHFRVDSYDYEVKYV